MMTELFQKALDINSPWFIKPIDFDMQTKRLDIYIDFKHGATFIDDAEEFKQPYKAYDTQQKTWQHLNF